MGWFPELVGADCGSELYVMYGLAIVCLNSVSQMQSKASEKGRNLRGINMSDQKIIK